MADRVGSSEKFIEIDLLTTTPPFTFQDAFVAAYPNTGSRSFLSRTIIALDGPGTLGLRDSEGYVVPWTMQAYEYSNVVAVGIESSDGITRVKVLL